MINREEIKALARDCGADLCGVASVDRFSEAPAGFHPRDIYPAARSVIVLAARLPDSAFTSEAAVPYTFLSSQVSAEMARTLFRLVRELDRRGVTAVPVPSEPYEFWDKETLIGRGILSLRHAAALAGLGTITRNHLLTSPELGNRIVLSAVLTDLAIEPDPAGEWPVCPPSCRNCRTLCPVQAITDEGIIQQRCRSRAEGLNERGFYMFWCRACREKCPLSRGKRAGPAEA